MKGKTMADSLTESVARLYRAGSEHSQQTEKLRIAVDNLLLWMKINIPFGFKLPDNCKIYPSGEFVQYDNSLFGKRKFGLEMGKVHLLQELSEFSKLIADGFIERLVDKLEENTKEMQRADEKICTLLAVK